LRSAVPGVSRQRAAACREGARGGRTGVHVRMGALRRQRRPRGRHANVRGVRATEGPPEEVRLRAGTGGHGREGAPGSTVSDGVDGSSSPLGATPSPAGVNFSVFSKHATGVELLFF